METSGPARSKRARTRASSRSHADSSSQPGWLKANPAALIEPIGARSEGKRYQVARLCWEAAVTQVCTHSLRGLHATIHVQAGLSAEDVARALGHADRGATALRHYVAAGAEQHARQQRGRVAPPR